MGSAFRSLLIGAALSPLASVATDSSITDLRWWAFIVPSWVIITAMRWESENL
jgi:hypothetical protein